MPHIDIQFTSAAQDITKWLLPSKTLDIYLCFADTNASLNASYCFHYHSPSLANISAISR